MRIRYIVPDKNRDAGFNAGKLVICMYKWLTFIVSLQFASLTYFNCYAFISISIKSYLSPETKSHSLQLKSTSYIY